MKKILRISIMDRAEAVVIQVRNQINFLLEDAITEIMASECDSETKIRAVQLITRKWGEDV